MLVLITYSHNIKNLLDLGKYFRNPNLTFYPTIHFTDEETEAQSLIQQRFSITDQNLNTNLPIITSWLFSALDLQVEALSDIIWIFYIIVKETRNHCTH